MSEHTIIIELLGEGAFQVSTKPTAPGTAVVFYSGYLQAVAHAKKWHRENGWPIDDKAKGLGQ